MTIADIVRVNGQPAKGTLVFAFEAVNLRPAPNPGDAIADVTRNGVLDVRLEIQDSNGVPVGTMMAAGLAAGPPSPGMPLEVAQGNLAITGGTGSFLGARGDFGQAAMTVPARQTSMIEDPSQRRNNGGGKTRFVLHVIPMLVPQVANVGAVPAIVHSGDFTLVSASKPAMAGEILSVFLTGLGPTRPRVDPGKPFPASPLALVNSPVAVTVNGEAAQVVGAAGFPGSTDGYQVNFQVPTDAASGSAAVQISAAWIAGTPVNINIR